MNSQKSIIKLLTVAIVLGGLSACVSPKKVAELEEKYEKCEADRKYMASETLKYETENNELKSNVDQLQKQVKRLVGDTTELGKQIDRLTKKYDKLNELNDELLRKQAKAAAGTEAENQKLLMELQAAMDKLLAKEDTLRQLEKELNQRSKNLDKLNADLQAREKKVEELQRIIAQKDSAVLKLKKRVQDALLNFEGKGLTVEQKNGRIYVSMEAKLLFPSGSWALNEDGKQALIDLAKALENQKDITILVEGHTDIDPYTGAGQIKDNWDLSVVRATTVVRFMLEKSNLSPAMLTAAGRSEFVPVDPSKTTEAKAKNRRIEIILTPNLDQLFQLLDEKAAE